MEKIDEITTFEAMAKALKMIEPNVESREEKQELRKVGLALLFIYTKKMWPEFRQFASECDGPLDDEQLRHLNSIGISTPEERHNPGGS
jgi:hypothetical protein